MCEMRRMSVSVGQSINAHGSSVSDPAASVGAVPAAEAVEGGSWGALAGGGVGGIVGVGSGHHGFVIGA